MVVVVGIVSSTLEPFGSADIVGYGSGAVFNEAYDTAYTGPAAADCFTKEYVVAYSYGAFGPACDTACLIVAGIYVCCGETVFDGSRAFAGVTDDTTGMVPK